MNEKLFRYVRQTEDEIHHFIDTSDESAVFLNSRQMDSSELTYFVSGRDYLASCDDQGFWRFEVRD